jgi:hypothetical protein
MPFIAVRLDIVSIMYDIFVVFTMTAGFEAAHVAIFPPMAILPDFIEPLIAELLMPSAAAAGSAWAARHAARPRAAINFMRRS